jgi:hypothetical protein
MDDVQKRNIVTCPGFAWLIRRALDSMIEFIGPLYNWLQQFTNHYLTHCHLLPTGHSRLLTTLHHSTTPLYSKSKSHCDWRSVSQSVSLGVEPHLGFMTRYLLCLTVTVLFFVGRPLWRKDGSVFCICCWPLPAQFFSGPSARVLATIFYCLRFETFLFVASYDSQGRGLRPAFWRCPLITPRHGPHRKHRLLLSKMRVYWSIT